MRRFLLILFAVFMSIPVLATTRYVLASATGTNAGTDWTNAYPDLATALSAATRGDLIYIGSGTYTTSGATGFGFSTTDSGTTTSELRAAIASDHGTSTGWNAATMGTDTTPATLKTSNGNAGASILTFSSDYWVINGNGRTDYENGYHLIVDNTWPNAVSWPVNFSGSHDITWEYVKTNGAGLDINNGETTSGSSFSCSATTVSAVVNTNGTNWHTPFVGKWISVSGVTGGSGFNTTSPVQVASVTDQTHFTYTSTCSGSGTGGTIVGPFTQQEQTLRIVSNLSYNIIIDHSYITNSSSDPIELVSSSTTGNGLILSYSEINANASNASLHSEGIGVQQGNNVIIKYNVFRDTEGTSGMFDVLCATGCPQTSNNWAVYGNVAYISNNNSTNRTGNGWGLVVCQQTCTNFKMYNNTVINYSDGGAHAIWAWQSLGNGATCSNIDVKNNVVYSSSSGASDPDGNTTSCTSYTRDYNTWLNSSGPTSPSANEVVTPSGAPNPFTNWTGSPGNFSLSSDIPNRVLLGAPYDTDAAGNAYTSSRGAYQFNGAPPVITPAPAPMFALKNPYERVGQ